MTRYLDLLDEQFPFEMPEDAQGRGVYVFNLMATKHPSETFLEELSNYLTSQGITAQIMVGGQTDLPSGDGPFITLRQTGGLRSVRVHPRVGNTFERPSTQVSVRAKSSRTAKSLAYKVWTILTQIRNQDLVVPAWAVEEQNQQKEMRHASTKTESRRR